MKLKQAILLLLFTGMSFASAHAQVDAKIGGNKSMLLLKNGDPLARPTGFVTDFEHVFNKEQSTILQDECMHFEKETGIEIAIVTIDTTKVTGEMFEGFAGEIGNAWGVGKKGKDNGILVALSIGHRKIRIANGRGIEKLISDKETKKIIEQYFIPAFKNSDYFAGTVAGLKQLMHLLKSKIKDKS